MLGKQQTQALLQSYYAGEGGDQGIHMWLEAAGWRGVTMGDYVGGAPPFHRGADWNGSAWKTAKLAATKNGDTKSWLDQGLIKPQVAHQPWFLHLSPQGWLWLHAIQSNGQARYEVLGPNDALQTQVAGGSFEGAVPKGKLIELMLYFELNQKGPETLKAEQIAGNKSYDELTWHRSMKDDPDALNKYHCGKQGGTWTNGVCQLPKDIPLDNWWHVAGTADKVVRIDRPPAFVVPGKEPEPLTPAKEVPALTVKGFQFKTWHLVVGVALLALVALLVLRGK